MSRCPDPQDRLERWQAFLVDGFEDWLPAATIAAGAIINGKPRDVLKGMLYDFYFPEGVEQSTDHIVAFLESWAVRSNANVRDPETGQIVGRMRDGRTEKPVPPANPDPVRAAKEKRKKVAEKKA